jgi:hypothetical protein
LIGCVREERTDVPELRIADGLACLLAPPTIPQPRDSPVFLCFWVFFDFTRLAHADRNADVEKIQPRIGGRAERLRVFQRGIGFAGADEGRILRLLVFVNECFIE